MPNYNSVIDAIHGTMDKMINAGILKEDAKVSNIPDALANFTDAYLAQIGTDEATAIRNANKNLDKDIADQTSFLLDSVASHVISENPLTNLALDANISASMDLLGKYVTDIQSNVAINGRKITGTLNYVEGYTDFSGLESEQSGHYLALHADVADQTGVTYKINGVTLDASKTHILIVKNKFKPVVVTAEKEGYGKITKSYDISGLVLEPKPEEENG